MAESPASKLRAAIEALAQGKQARLEPSDLCAVLHENERLRALLGRVMVSGNHLATHIDMDGPTWREPHDQGLKHYGPGAAYDAWCCWKGIMLVREEMP